MRILLLTSLLLLSGCTGSAWYYSGGMNSNEQGEQGAQVETGLLYRNMKLSVEKVVNAEGQVETKYKVDFIEKVNL